MPYAIYKLTVNDMVCPEFTSYAKDRGELIADVAKYLYQHVQELVPRFPPKSMVKIKHELDDIATLMNRTEIVVTETIDEVTGHKLDRMLQFLDDVKRIKAEHVNANDAHFGNKAGEIEFGVRKLIATRMSVGYQEQPFEWRREQHSQFNWYFAQVEAITYLLRTHSGATHRTFDKLFNEMVSAIMQSPQIQPLSA